MLIHISLLKSLRKKWTNLCECHELYCAGHLIEAGVAYYHATGKNALLTISCKFADHIYDVFGNEPGKLAGYPGHPEVELALMRLYEVTQNEKYLNICKYFIEQRGQQPHFYDIEFKKRGETSFWHVHGPAWMIKDKHYSQAHIPLAEQHEAVGHAVRFVYLLAGVAHLARISKDQEKLGICKILWDNMVNKQMYVTGGIGSQSCGESFSCDYDLPNDTAYTETCASIGLMMFANRMLQLDTNSKYGDVMERALYNTVLAGMALDGKHFFYVNPLEVHPKSIQHNHIYDHVKPTRQQWFGCACCPPNIARIIGSIGNYIYSIKDDGVLVNLYIGNKTHIELPQGQLLLEQNGNYPWQDSIQIDVSPTMPLRTKIALRIPDWCHSPILFINDQQQELESIISQGYAEIDRIWKAGDRIRLSLPMDVMVIRGNPLLRHADGKIAIQRGPLVYCIEEQDNGAELHNIRLDSTTKFETFTGNGLFAGKTLIKADSVRIGSQDAQLLPLYSYNQPKPETKKQELILIPYFTWANRSLGEMRVWINEK